MKTRLGRITLATVAILTLLLFGMLAQSYRALAAPLDSYNVAWKLVRDTATEDGANLAAVYALATGEGNWASRDTTAVFRLFDGPSEPTGPASTPDSPGVVWKFVICGGLADDDTFSFDVLGWAQGNGMAQVIATGDGVIGTQDVVLYPDDSAAATDIWWADTINLDATTTWPGVSVYNSGNNTVGMLLIDTTGLEFIQFVIYDAGGTGTEANNLTIFGRPY